MPEDHKSLKVHSRSPVDGKSRNCKVRRVAKPDPALLFCRIAREGDDADAPSLALSSFKNIVVLGDSYSAHTRKNWIGFLLERFLPHSSPSIHINFVHPGDTAEHNLDAQLKRPFGKLPSANSAGGKSCRNTDADNLKPIIEQIFDALHELYVKWKGRTFLLIDVPLMHQLPGEVDLGLDSERYVTWNEELFSQAESFAESAAHASTHVVSSYGIIDDLLDSPESYGLEDRIKAFSDDGGDSDGEEREDEEDSCSESGSNTGVKEKSQVALWEDNIHLSRAAHKAFADRVWEALRE